MKNHDLSSRLAKFFDAFENVFGYGDWEYTKSRILDEDFIKENGTFLDPYPGEYFTGGKGDNWGSRSHLLSAYRELRAFAISEGIYNPEHLNEYFDE